MCSVLGFLLPFVSAMLFEFLVDVRTEGVDCWHCVLCYVSIVNVVLIIFFWG